MPAVTSSYLPILTLAVTTGFFFQAEDGIRDLVRSRGLGDVYKRQRPRCRQDWQPPHEHADTRNRRHADPYSAGGRPHACLLYTSDAADERSSVDLGGRRIIKKRQLVRRIQHGGSAHQRRMWSTYTSEQ